MKAIGAILVATLVLVAPTGAVAQPQSDREVPGAQTLVASAAADTVTQDTAEALAADLQAVGEANGWSADQLAAYEDAEAALDVITDRLWTTYPDAFVGSALADDPTEPPTVYVKGTAPAEIRVLARELGIAVVEGQPYSLEEIDTRLAAVQAAVVSGGFNDMMVSADIQREGAITLVVVAPSEASLAPILAGIVPEIANDITVSIVTNPVVEPQGAFGGMRLQDGGVFECTSGWTVRKLSNNVRGVSGAGHCNGIDQINHPGHGVHATAQQPEHIGQWGDVEWYTTTQAEADDFYGDEFNNIRDVVGIEPRANIAIGEAICVYGRASNHRDCTLDVENPDVFCGFPQQKLVQMNGAVTIGGDSGGGWSFGGTAYGGHFGLCFNKSSFSVADLFDEALGVVVAVN